MVAAIARRAHLGDLRPSDAASAIAQFRAEFRSSFRVIEITADLIDVAMTLADRGGLRGYDAVELASALAVSVDAGAAAPTFVSADAALNAAAAAAGLLVQNPNDQV